MDKPFFSMKFSRTGCIITIVIFLFLAGLILPALSRARESASRAKCTSNLKQICLALKQYALDNKEIFPWEENTKLYCSVFGKVYPAYTDQLEIFTCPSSNDRLMHGRKGSKDNEVFNESECKASLSYAYGHDQGKPWTESAPSSTRIGGDKYALQNYLVNNYPKNRRSNHHMTWLKYHFIYSGYERQSYRGSDGRHVVRLDGSAAWDNSRNLLEANPEWDVKVGMSVDNPEYKRLDESSPESDQTGADWWSDPPEK
jgi:type II secretory pathway pseudopilin PulG